MTWSWKDWVVCGPGQKHPAATSTYALAAALEALLEEFSTCESCGGYTSAYPTCSRRDVIDVNDID